jgi:hypothetical protein
MNLDGVCNPIYTIPYDACESRLGCRDEIKREYE